MSDRSDKGGAPASLVPLLQWQWLTTAPNPHIRSYGPDQGQRGWRLHAIKALDTDRLENIAGHRAACGVIPSHGWGVDMFIERKCARCMLACGIACTECRGIGRRGARTCVACIGTGTLEMQKRISLAKR